MAVIQNRFKSKSVLLPEEWDNDLRTQMEQLTPEEMEVLQACLEDDGRLLEFTSDAISTEYERVPVPIEEWLSEYYLGDSVKSLYKVWRDDLILLFSTNMYELAMCLGGIGSGKTEFAVIAILRMLYEASCLKDPAASYGLASGSIISFCVLSKTEQVAKAAIFEKVVAKIQQSEYFQNEFRVLNQMKDNRFFKGTQLTFGKGLMLVCGSSSDSSILGANVMGGFIDELNFFQRAAKNAYDARYGVYGKAGILFDQLKRRIRSRFQRFGKLPGLLIGASSKTTKDSLTEQFVREAVAKSDSAMFVRDYSILDVKPEAFSTKKFKVLVGNEVYSSKILEEGEDKNYAEDVAIVEVPEEFRRDFESDLNNSLRDLLGISTTAIHSFINKVEKINAMKDESRKHPFHCALMPDPSQWDSRSPYVMDWNKLCKIDDKGEWLPILNPWAKRYASFDAGLTGDAFGIVIAHIAGLIPVNKKTNENDITEYVPYFIVDFVLRIKGQPGEEILFRNVRRLLYEFSTHGFHIAHISVDKFESRDMLQTLREQGYKAEILSVDEEKDPYLNLRRVIYDERIKCYPYEILTEELRCLEETPVKIDHSNTGIDSKDLADALCACIYSLTCDATYSEPIMPQKGMTIDEPEEQKNTNKYDENFVEITKQGDTIVDNTKVVYRKKEKQVLKPQYVKITAV